MSEPRDSTSTSDESGRVRRLSTSDLAGRVFRGLMAPDADAPQRPPLIDGYRLLTPLGLGGQGTTWLAERVGKPLPEQFKPKAPSEKAGEKNGDKNGEKRNAPVNNAPAAKVAAGAR